MWFMYDIWFQKDISSVHINLILKTENKNNTSRVYFQSFFRWAPCLKPHNNNPINILTRITAVTTVATAAAVTAIT